MKAIHRLFEYLDIKKLPHTRYEKDIGLSNGYLKTQLRRNADIGESVIMKIIDYSLDINPIWLLTGEGPMLKQAAGGEKAGVEEGPPGRCPFCQEKEKLIAAQQRTIDILERELLRCQAELDHLHEKARHPHDDGQKRKAG